MLNEFNSEYRLLLVRHGQDEDNAAGILNGHRDTPLTDLGMRQAQIVGSKLRDFEVHAIFSSPLIRARQTAEVIASTAASGMSPQIEPLLIERDFGVLTGRMLSEIPTLGGALLETEGVTYFLEAPNAETFPATLSRARRALRSCIPETGTGTVVLVTHGDIGKMIRAAYFHWDWKTGLETPFFGNTEILELAASGQEKH